MSAKTKASTAVDEPLSVPDVADAIGMRVDRLRVLLRRNPKMAALFATVGGTRILRDGDALERLQEMLIELETAGTR